MGQSVGTRWGTLAVAIVIGVGLAVAISYWPHHANSPLAEGQTLLGRAAESFTDEQLGLQFKPPPMWSMQGRTLWSPNQTVPSRFVVKYKRLVRDVPVAWLRVFVHEVPADQSMADFLRKHKLPEKSWKVTKDVEPGLQVGKLPAARITYAGPLDPNGLGATEYTAEVFAIRRGKLLFEISGTYPTADEEARKQFQASLESLKFLRP